MVELAPMAHAYIDCMLPGVQVTAVFSCVQVVYSDSEDSDSCFTGLAFLAGP